MFQASDWYSMTKNSINVANQRAKKLWKYYPSLKKALRDLYPEYPWDPLQFARVRLRHSLLPLIVKAEQQLGIQQVKGSLHGILLPHSLSHWTY